MEEGDGDGESRGTAKSLFLSVFSRAGYPWHLMAGETKRPRDY